MENFKTVNSDTTPHTHYVSNAAGVLIDNIQKMNGSIKELENKSTTMDGAIKGLETISVVMKKSIEDLEDDSCSMNAKVAFYEVKMKEMDNAIDELRRTMYKSYTEMNKRTSNALLAIIVIQIIVFIAQIVNFII